MKKIIFNFLNIIDQCIFPLLYFILQMERNFEFSYFFLQLTFVRICITRVTEISIRPRINLVSAIYISAGKFRAFVQNNTDFVTRQHDMSHVLLSLLGGSCAKFRTYLGNLLSRSEFAFNLSPRVCRLNNLFLLIHRVPHRPIRSFGDYLGCSLFA